MSDSSYKATLMSDSCPLVVKKTLRKARHLWNLEQRGSYMVFLHPEIYMAIGFISHLQREVYVSGLSTPMPVPVDNIHRLFTGDMDRVWI